MKERTINIRRGGVTCPPVSLFRRMMGWGMGLMLLAGLQMSPAANLYVATNGTGSGAAWSAAYTNLADALVAAADHDTIYLAGHTFILTNQVLWTSKTNLALRGGYAATNDAGLPGERNSARWPTLLARTNGAAAPFFRLLDVQGVTNGVIEQVSFGGGYFAFTPDSEHNGGGAIRLDRCSNISLLSCVITGNVAIKSGGTYGTAYGGGIWATNCVLMISNCVVRDNQTLAGSGAYAVGAGVGIVSGTVTLIDTVLSANRARGNFNTSGLYGGGLYNKNGRVVLQNCLVSGNLAINFGFKSTDMTSGATYRGGGLHNEAGTLVVLNSTIANNANSGICRMGGTVAATNCIVWGNRDDLTGTVTLAYCNIENGDSNGVSGNFSADPLFERGFYLASNSPCLNAGTGNAADWGVAAPYVIHADGTADAGVVDVGWHYAQGLGSQVLYVSPAGSDSNNGTNWAGAFRSIKQALRQATPGTRIHIASGSYTNPHEAFPLSLQGVTGVQLVGTNAADTIVNAAGSGARILIAAADGIRLEGLTLRGGYTVSAISGEGGGGLNLIGCSGVLLSNCILTGNVCGASDTYPMTQGGGIRMLAGSLTVEDSLVTSNVTISTSGGKAYGGGISVAGGNFMAIRSVFRSNRAYGNAWNNAPEILGGAIANHGGNILLRNCLLTTNQTVNTNPSGLNGGRALANADGVSRIENCTLVHNVGDGVRQKDGILAVTNSILWSNGDDVTGAVVLAYCDVQNGTNTGVSGNISADPLFEGAATNNYRLLKGSPCIDAGINLPGMITEVDLGGVRRLQGGLVDLGAFEAPSTISAILIQVM